MARRLNSKRQNFAADFEALLFAKREVEEDVAASVEHIIAEVRERGDTALVELGNKFDRANLTLATLKLSAAEIDAATGSGDPGAEERNRNRRHPHRGLSPPPIAQE